MDHEVAMEDGLFFMVQLDGLISFKNFIKKKTIYKVFGPLTRCKLNVDQEEWPCTQKWMCFFNIYMLKKGNFEEGGGSSLTILLSSSSLPEVFH